MRELVGARKVRDRLAIGTDRNEASGIVGAVGSRRDWLRIASRTHVVNVRRAIGACQWRSVRMTAAAMMMMMMAVATIGVQ